MSLAKKLTSFDTKLPFLINANNPSNAYDELKQFVFNTWGANLDEYHPNIFIVRPEHERISVDQIRALKNFLNQTSTQDFKLAVIYEIDKINIYGANACLKLLEEASLDTKIFLISSNPYKLPITVRSRCCKIRHLSSEIKEEAIYKKIILGLQENKILGIIEPLDLKSDWINFSTNCQGILNRIIQYQLDTLKNINNDEVNLFDKCKANIDTLIKLFEEIKLLSDHATRHELDRRAIALLILGMIHEHFSN
ncbi:Putative DNA polymerase III subunit delta [Candidatus Phycorickettsia trachydisci]|uniref:DNA polymerase III subunit delta n=1 Tax=Candidatus Phycorickettsia trachydisci TaxID=2115978 RepID=A0A2P1P9T7_9RICK|nr:hypothetical protein [Candidatus Phycorickettsia trachydisci]AVP88005.1 Putative DNA polymerase III subunit delta [Candidatus Phycorickettsia trachydisci]